MNARDDDSERPRWREGDEDEDGPREWETEPEEEKEDRHPVLGGTAPVAGAVFIFILIVVALGAVAALFRALGG